MFDGYRDHQKIVGLDERLTTVERQFKAMQVEWCDTLDRLRTMMLRMRKEAERSEAAHAEEMPQTNLSDEDVSSGQTALPGLTERQAEITQRILARRNRNRSTQ